jgi:hypothetical protein
MKHLAVALAVAVFAWAAPAFADTIPLSLILTVDEETTVFEELEGTLDPSGIFRGEGELDGVGFEVEWDLRGDLDPALTIGLAVTDTGAPSVFSFVFGLPVGSIPAPTVTGGSIGGSITDGNGDGATISDAGQPIYTALINGSPFQTMLDNPYSLSATDPFSTVGIPVESFGIPGLTVPGPGVTVTDMGIEIRFALSGGNDAAAITANFVVEPFIIPEPATMSLLGIGVAGFLGSALRRRMRNA